MPPKPVIKHRTHSNPTAILASSEGAAGCGSIELRHVADKTAVTRSRAASPLKLLNPRRDSPAAWIYMSTYGGGLVSGDQIRVDIDAGPDTLGVIATQASTKVFRSIDAGATGQQMTACIGERSLLVVAPDPLVCFAHSNYKQHQKFDLAATASLALIDWFTCGRLARGERWAMDRLYTRNEVAIEGRRLITDTLLLDAADGPIGHPARVGPFNCFASILLVGPAVKPLADAAVERISALPIDRGGRLMTSVSAKEWGAAVRIAGMSAEEVGAAIAGDLEGLKPLLGAGIWDRKF